VADLITDNSDKSVRMLTIADCESARKICEEKLGKFLVDESDQELAQAKIEAEIDIWDRIMFHLNNGEIITINDKKQIHWVQSEIKTKN
jgi:hypothetical protein